MTDTTNIKFSVELNIDNEVWNMNYAPENTSEDIRQYMQTVIEELINQHLDASGNEGLVHVSEAKRGRKFAS